MFAKLGKFESRIRKKYWKFLNGNKNTQATARLEDLFEHFRNVNRVNDNEELGAALNENYVQHENDTEINGPITLDEIIKAVRRLKNNKSSGIDMVLNEHIKMSWNIPQFVQSCFRHRNSTGSMINGLYMSNI